MGTHGKTMASASLTSRHAVRFIACLTLLLVLMQAWTVSATKDVEDSIYAETGDRSMQQSSVPADLSQSSYEGGADVLARQALQIRATPQAAVRCNLKLFEMDSSKVRDQDTSVVQPKTTRMRIPGVKNAVYSINNLRLTHPKFYSRKIQIVLLVEKLGVSKSSFDSVLSRGAAIDFVRILSQINHIWDVNISVCLVDSYNSKGYRNLGFGIHDSELASRFEVARSTIIRNHGRRQSDILKAAERLMERSPTYSYHLMVIMTNMPWVKSDEKRFVQRAKVSNWALTFVPSEAVKSAAANLVSLIRHSWLSSAVWHPRWPNTFYVPTSGNGIMLMYEKFQEIHIAPVNEAFSQLIPARFYKAARFDINNRLTITTKIPYEVKWNTRFRDYGKNGLLPVELLIYGWGYVQLNIEYIVPPISRDASETCSKLTCRIELPISDLYGNLMDVIFTELPSVGSLINPRTKNTIKKNDCLNEFTSGGAAVGKPEKSVIYKRGPNGDYRFRYVVNNGCRTAQQYTMNIHVNAPNSQMVAGNMTISVDSGSYVVNAKPFTMKSAMIHNIDPYYPIYIRPRILPDPMTQGTLYDSNKKPVKPNGSRNYLLEDAFYYIPADKPSVALNVAHPVFLFALEETASQLNMSNTAWLHVILKKGSNLPFLMFQYNTINLDMNGNAIFTPVIYDRYGQELELYVTQIPPNSSIFLNGVAVDLTHALPIKLLGGINPTPLNDHRIVLHGFSWNIARPKGNTRLQSVFYVKRKANQLRSPNVTLDILVRDTGNTPTNSICYRVTVPMFDQGSRSPTFYLLGTDMLTMPPGNKDIRFVITKFPTDIGHLHYADTGALVPIGQSLNASDPFGPIGDPVTYGSKLSLYFEPNLLSNRTYASGKYTFKYTAFNGYVVSPAEQVLISIAPKVFVPTSESRDVYMQENTTTMLNLPIVARNGLPGYLDFGKDLDRHPNLSASARADANDPDTVILSITSFLGRYSYMPGKTPVALDTLTYRACEGKGLCDNAIYSAVVYVVHVPHPPTSSDHAIRVVRTQLTKVELPAADVDAYDLGKLRATLFFDSIPTGRFYRDPEGKQLIDTTSRNGSQQLDSITFYYVCDMLNYALDVSVDRIAYLVTDTTKLTSSVSMLTTFVDPHGDPPTTSLHHVVINQGARFVLSLTDPDCVTSERLGSPVRATITSLPPGSLFECMDSDCSDQMLQSKAPLDKVPVVLSQAGTNSRLLYIPPPDQWGENYASIEYTLTDELTNKSSETTLQLAIDVVHVNAAPVLINHNTVPTTLKQSEVYEFSWSLTDVDTSLEQLYSTLDLSITNSHTWSLSRCDDVDCNATTTIIAPNDAKNRTYSLLPSVIIRKGNNCPLANDIRTRTHSSSLEDCSVLFKYRLYADQRIFYRTFLTFSLVGSDSLSLSNAINNVLITYLFVNRPPTIWVPELIVSSDSIRSPFLRDNNETSPTYNQSITITDPGSRLTCLEKLIMSSNVTGTFDTPPELNCSTVDNTVECVGTVVNLNNWLPSFRFSTNQSYIQLTFTISDQGCSTDVPEDDFVYSATANTVINLTAKISNNSDSTLGIVIGSVAITSAVALATTAYFLRRYLSSPPNMYFDIGNENIATTPENPLFQSKNQEYTSPLYKNL